MGIITTVTWSEYAIGAPDGATGSHRAKLQGGQPNSTVSIFSSGTDFRDSPSWNRQASPPTTEQLNGMTFQFAFWSVKLTRDDTGDSFTSIQQGSEAIVNVDSSDDTATFTGEAHAYYVWVPGDVGPGGPSIRYVLIDAFDTTLNDFIPDDPFVDVFTASDPGGNNFISLPYPSDPLSAGANDLGYIDTDATIPLSETVKISAMDPLGGSGGMDKPFSTWLPVTVTGNATVGQGNPHDIVVGHDDTVVAFAIYSEARKVVDPTVAGPGSVDWTIYQMESLTRVQAGISQQLTTLTQQMAGQEERTATLTSRFDAVAASIMALSARVEALQKMDLEGQAFIRAENGPFAWEQVTAARAVQHRGLFARLFRRGT
jgi:hypothetical protein